MASKVCSIILGSKWGRSSWPRRLIWEEEAAYIMAASKQRKRERLRKDQGMKYNYQVPEVCSLPVGPSSYLLPFPIVSPAADHGLNT